MSDIAALMNSLDPLERAALRMVYSERLTQIEIARQLNVSITAVRAAVARGMLRIAAGIAEP